MDLRSNNKGLKLPTVSLTDTADFQLSPNSSDAASAIGMTVYNTNNNTKGGRGQGIYTWNGTWIYSGGAPRADILVNRIIITSEDGAAVKANKRLQLTTYILPENASNKTLAWSVPWSSSLTAGKASVDDTGLVTGIKPGSVTVRASAIDGSNAYRDFTLTVRPDGEASSIAVSSETGEYSVAIGQSLQLIAAITPESASQRVRWEVTGGSDCAVLTDATNGVVKGIAEGAATITATAFDSPGVSETRDISITPISPIGVDSVTFPSGNKYATYDVYGTEWMLDFLREDGYDAYTGNTVNGSQPFYCYPNSQAPFACPSGWRLPSSSDVYTLAAAAPLGSDLHYRLVTTENWVHWVGAYVHSTTGVQFWLTDGWAQGGVSYNFKVNVTTSQNGPMGILCVR